jgi:tripartite-type tricarboxylate transporter receptor subunit TctC
LAALSIAKAQSYPSRPITVVVPSGAGSPLDVIARIIVERMRNALGQVVIIENVPGAAGAIGIGRVARAKPDGSIVAFGSFNTHVVHGAVRSLPYDVINDFEPIALVTSNPQLISAKKAIPADDLKGLLAWLRENPDKASLGQTGPGSPAHIAGILFQRQTGTRFQFANYRSAGQAMQDMIAGHIDLMFTAPNIALEHMRAGSIKVYAVTAGSRLAVAPEVPTADEAGLRGFYASFWQAFWAPKGTPQDVIARLNAAVVDALADATVRQRLAELGNEIFAPEQQKSQALRAFQKAEIERWWPILKEAGIEVE